MIYQKVGIKSIAYHLPDEEISSRVLEEQLTPLYKRLHIRPGQLEKLTGIYSRRWWSREVSFSEKASIAGKKALQKAGVHPEELGILIYGAVCREFMEPATAIVVADRLGVKAACEVLDISNACLAVMNGIVHIANAIELGQVDVGMVVSCESAREPVEQAIYEMNYKFSSEVFQHSMATLTGGSGACAVIVSRRNEDAKVTKLIGGVHRCAPQYNKFCRWGHKNEDVSKGLQRVYLRTDAGKVLTNGVILGRETWKDYLTKTSQTFRSKTDKIVCHQVARTNREAILKELGISKNNDFVTYPFLGNMGAVSLPTTAAIAEEEGFLRFGDKVHLLGIGSGLNCTMLGLEWMSSRLVPNSIEKNDSKYLYR